MLVVGRVGACAIALSSVIACGPARIIDQSGTDTGSSSGDDGASSSSSSSSSSSGGSSSSSSSSSGGNPTTGGETSTGTTTDGDGVFIGEPDGGDDIECDVMSQNCPEGEKCMPWANDGGSAWNATKCAPLDPNPMQPGDTCTVDGNAVSGVDNCEAGSMCWDVDPQINEGVCIAFCTGSYQSPVCEDPSTVCTIYNDGVLPLCLPMCDPLLQNCHGDNICVPASGPGFICVLDASGEEGQYGDPCEYVNVCDPGLYCANAEAVPGCQGAVGCCSDYCDLTAPVPVAACSGAGQGQECVPWFEEGTAPPGLEHIGGCAIPQ